MRQEKLTYKDVKNRTEGGSLLDIAEHIVNYYYDKHSTGEEPYFIMQEKAYNMALYVLEWLLASDSKYSHIKSLDFGNINAKIYKDTEFLRKKLLLYWIQGKIPNLIKKLENKNKLNDYDKSLLSFCKKYNVFKYCKMSQFKKELGFTI